MVEHLDMDEELALLVQQESRYEGRFCGKSLKLNQTHYSTDEAIVTVVNSLFDELNLS